jgi:hypothetical protein
MGFSNNTIKFYSRSQSFFELSNFYPSSFELDGRWWRTVEHYVQAKKSLDESEQELIRNTHKTTTIKKLVDSMKIRDDWEEVREDIVYKALKAKFTQNKKLKMLLLSTGTCDLMEDSPTDMYWGGRGKNRLGELLKTLRTELENIK